MTATPSSSGIEATAAERGSEQACGSALRTVLLLIVAAFLTWMAMHQWDPPKPRPASTGAADFSAERALAHVRQLAREPHFVGTPAHDAARDYVVAQLAALGGNPEVEKTAGVATRGNDVFAASVQNVLARFPGSGNAGGMNSAAAHPLLLMAHYDSAEHAPGAADDASGVATILETVRALRAGPRLRNEVIVLITDAEEAGLLGAAAFVRQHPWAKDVGLVLNFESRGTEGPVLMFETSKDNGALLREAARAAPGLVGSSFMYSIYQRLPNDTDLTVTKRAGLPGLNFAFIDGFENYHMRTDSPERLSARTLQQNGDYALALARHFGNLPLPVPRAPDAVFFNLSGRMVTYPAAWSVKIADGVLIAFLILLVAAWQSGKASAAKVVAAMVALLAAGVGSLLVAWGAWRVLSTAVFGRMQLGGTPSNEYLLLAAALASAAPVAFVYAVLQGRLGWRNVAAGSAGMAAIAGVLASRGLPAGGYLVAWPAAAAVVTVAVLLFAVDSQTSKTGSSGAPLFSDSQTSSDFRTSNSGSPGAPLSSGKPLWLAVAVVGAMPVILLLAPMAWLFLVGLSLGPISVLAAGLVVWLGALAAAPLVLAIQARRAWTAAAILLLAAAAWFAAGDREARFSAQHPGRDSLLYVIDADQKRAQWMSTDARTDAWTEKFLGKNPRRGIQPAMAPGVQLLSADAPLLPWPAPEIKVVSDENGAGSRTLKLRVQPGRAAQILRIRSEGAAVSAVTLNGATERIGRPGRLLFSYAAPPEEGIELTLLAAPGPLTLRVSAISIGVPEAPGFPAPKLPDDVVAQYHSYMSVVTRKAAF